MSIIERLSNLFGIPLTMLGTGLAISLFGLDKLGIVTPVAMIYFIIGVFLEGVALIWIVTIVTHFWKNRNLVIKNKKGYKPSQKILQTDSRNKLSRQLIKNMALSIVMGVVIGTLLLYIYIFLILYQKSLISLYPILVLFFFTIIAISAFKNEEFRKHWWKYAAIFLSFMLTIQVVWPIFLPKVS
ncbi:MAG: hypothetical protein HYS80_00140, partial [Candidatus Aenigmarchaeota archaeon]|nr:hypothetical protein [Candidatus Aenigmarchaeota archaeon]